MKEAAVDGSDNETNEENIDIRKKSIYKDLPDLKEVEGAPYQNLTEMEEIMVDFVVHVSLPDTPSVISNEVGTSELTPGADAQVQADAPGTDFQTNGATS